MHNLSKMTAVGVMFVSVSACSQYPQNPHLKVAQDALETVYDSRELVEFSQIFGGQSASGVYKLRSPGASEPLILRIQNEGRTVEANAKEIAYQKFAADLGIAPKIHYSDPEAGVILMAYIQGEDLTHQDMKSEDLIRQLVAAIKTFHTSGFKAQEVRQFIETIEKVDGKLRKSKPENISSEVLKEAAKLARNLQNALVANLPLVPGHHDLNPMNLRYKDQQFYFLDWEGAGLTNPLEELAVVSLLFAFSEHQDQVMLKAYFENGLSEEILHDFDVIKRIALIRFALVLTYALDRRGELRRRTAEQIKVLPSIKEILKVPVRDISKSPDKTTDFIYAALREVGIG